MPGTTVGLDTGGHGATSIIVATGVVLLPQEIDFHVSTWNFCFFMESMFLGVDTIFICVFDHGIHVLHHRHKFFVSDLHISDSWPRHRPHISWWNHYIFHDCLHVTR